MYPGTWWTSVPSFMQIVKFNLANAVELSETADFVCKRATSVAHLTNLFSQISQNVPLYVFLYHGAKKSIMTKNSNQRRRGPKACLMGALRLRPGWTTMRPSGHAFMTVALTLRSRPSMVVVLCSFFREFDDGSLSFQRVFHTQRCF